MRPSHDASLTRLFCVRLRHAESTRSSGSVAIHNIFMLTKDHLFDQSMEVER